jgi:hypothetical protein
MAAFLIFVRRSRIFKEKPFPSIGSVILGGGILLTIGGNVASVD